MLKIFYGEDRVGAMNEIEKTLGSNYEVIEGPELEPTDLPNIFLGTSLLDNNRNILIRDLSSNKPVFEMIPNYLNTPHQIILFETKLDKRSNTYKTLKDKITI